jgi:hypothetical protein
MRLDVMALVAVRGQCGDVYKIADLRAKFEHDMDQMNPSDNEMNEDDFNCALKTRRTGKVSDDELYLQSKLWYATL